MDDEHQQQIEEAEVLDSIYFGDPNYKQIDAVTYQYKFEENKKTFLVEMKWGPKYPNEKPAINLDIFYNQHLLPPVREKILAAIDKEAERSLGAAMTYNIIECLKDKVEEVMEDQVEKVLVPRVEKIAVAEKSEPKKTEKKEHLTKSQKRRAWDRAEVGKAGEKPRGWDWVDIIKHLSQVPAHQQHTTT